MGVVTTPVELYGQNQGLANFCKGPESEDWGHMVSVTTMHLIIAKAATL